MTEMIKSEAIEIDEHNPSEAELDFAIAELTDIKHSIMSLSDAAGAGYRFASRMAGKSFINMQEKDLGFMRGYWLGLEAALKEVMDLLHDREGLRLELYGKRQENENAGD
jgi:hypothetical protein